MQFMTMFPMFAVRMRLGQSTLGLGQHGDLYRRSARADDLSRRADRAAHGLQLHAHTACAIGVDHRASEVGVVDRPAFRISRLSQLQLERTRSPLYGVTLRLAWRR